MNTDQRLRAAMEDLAGGPLPADLATRALSGAARRRRVRLAAGAGAGTLAVVAAVAMVPALMANQPVPSSPGVVVPTVAAACTQLPPDDATVKEVDPTAWPDFVRAAVAALPPRPDYVMQSGYAWCIPQGENANAYAVVNLGRNRDQGNLALYFYIKATDVPADCAQAAVHAQPLLFCDALTTERPMVLGFGDAKQVTVGAAYADGKAIVIEAHAGPDGMAISADQLREVVQDPALHAVIPDAATQFPGAASPVAQPS
jgi:hypothetical protein